MKKIYKFKVILAIILIALFLLSAIINSSAIDPEEYLAGGPLRDEWNPRFLTRGTIFVLDSGTPTYTEWIGMKDAILRSIEFCYVTDIIFGVIQFTDHAEWSISPRLINDDYTLADFKYDIIHLNPLSGSDSQMHKGVRLAKGRASNMIVMTDCIIGDPDLAYEECEDARELGQRISIASYFKEVCCYPFCDYTNCEGEFHSQPIGRWGIVSNPGKMIRKVAWWFYGDYPEIM